MKIKLVLMALVMGMVVLVVGTRAEATIMTFEAWAANNRGLEYLNTQKDGSGDNVGSRINTIIPITYLETVGTLVHNVNFAEGKGWTPNIALTWSGAHFDTYLWLDSGGNRGSVVQLDSTSPTSPADLVFTPEADWAVLINSFDLDEHNGTPNGDTVIDWEIFDDNGIMASGTWDDKNNANDPSNQGGRTTINTGLTFDDITVGNAVTLRFMQTSGNVLYTAVDNINFDQVVPIYLIEVDKPLLTVDEQGPTSDTYSIVLAYEPNADGPGSGGGDTVIILCEPNGLPNGKDTDINLGAGPSVARILTFTSDNWDTPQTITVAAVDDSDIEEDHAVTIKHTVISAGDPNYANTDIISVGVNISDNDVPVITLTESDSYTWVQEGGATDSYEIALNIQPTANVEITVEPNHAEVAVSDTPGGGMPGAAITLTFTTVNWNTPQNVYVKANDDAMVESDETVAITQTVGGTSQYATWQGGVPIPDVIVFVSDNDGAVFALEDALMLHLPLDIDYLDCSGLSNHGTPEPNENLNPLVAGKIGNCLNSSDSWLDCGNDASLKSDSEVTVSAWVKQSTIDYYGQIAGYAYDEGSTETGYSIISQNSGDPDGYQAWLRCTGTPNGGYTANVPAALNEWHLVVATYDGANVKVYLDGALGTIMAASGNIDYDPETTFKIGIYKTAGYHLPYNGLIDDVVVWSRALNMAEVQALYNAGAGTVISRPAGYLLVPTDYSTIVEEGGSNDTYTVELNTQPSADVQIAVATGTSEIVISGDPVTLTFTTANWNVPQTVTVQAYDDLNYDGSDPIVYKVTHTASSSDTDYDGFVDDMDVVVVDNDVPHVTIEPVTLDILEGESETYTAVLDTWPVNETGNVTIIVDPNNGAAGSELDLGGGAGTPIVLTFNSGNYSTPQTVTVTAAENTVLTTDRVAMITHTTESTAVPKGDYEGAVVDSVTVTLLEDDCGHWGYDSMDFNYDCYVDLLDLNEFASQWLYCTQPFESGCYNAN